MVARTFRFQLLRKASRQRSAPGCPGRYDGENPEKKRSPASKRSIMFLGLVAYRVGKRLDCGETTGWVADCPESSNLLCRPYRPGRPSMEGTLP
jgi:hypothetical protein